MIGVLWYIATLVGAFFWILGTPLGLVLSLGEMVVSAIPVGTIVGGYITFIVSACTSELSPRSLTIASVCFCIFISTTWKRSMIRWKLLLLKIDDEMNHSGFFETLFQLASQYVLSEGNDSAFRRMNIKRRMKINTASSKSLLSSSQDEVRASVSWENHVSRNPMYALTSRAKIDSILILLVCFLSSLGLWGLYSSHMIPIDPADGNMYSGGSCWADFPIHMAIAESFLQGRNMDVSFNQLTSPVFAGEKFYYPFIPDWHAAVITKLGRYSTLRQGFLLPGFLSAVAFCGLLFAFSLRITRSRLGSFFSVLLTLGAAGIGAWDVLRAKGISKALEIDTAQNDDTGGYQIFWFAFLPHVLLPQRGANFAYPMVLVSLLCLWVATSPLLHESGDKVFSIPFLSSSKEKSGIRNRVEMMEKAIPMDIYTSRGILMLSAFFAALLPLVQAHALIGVGTVIFVFFLLHLPHIVTDARVVVSWAMAGLLAISIAWPQLALFLNQVKKGNNGHFMNVRWIPTSNRYGGAGVYGFFKFWWTSTSTLPFLFLLGLAIVFVECVITMIATRLAMSSSKNDIVRLFYSCLPQAASVVAPSTSTTVHKRNQGQKFSSLSASGSSADSPFQYLTFGTMLLACMMIVESSLVYWDIPIEWLVESFPWKRLLLLCDPIVKHPQFTKKEVDSDDDSPEEVLHHMSSKSSASASKLPELLVDDSEEKGKIGENELDPIPHHKKVREFQAYKKHEISVLGSGIDESSMYSFSADNSGSILEHLFIQTISNLPHPFPLLFFGNYRIGTQFFLSFGYLWSANPLSLTGRSLDALKIGLGGLAVWILGNWVIFQPWDRDNCKLFYIWVFIASSFAGMVVAAPFEYLFSSFGVVGPGSTRLDVVFSVLFLGKQNMIISFSKKTFGLVVLCICLCSMIIGTFTGFLMIIREFKMYNVMIDVDQLEITRKLAEKVSPKAVIMYRDNHLLAPAAAGRSALLSYQGWMSSHGYDFGERSSDRDYVLANILQQHDINREVMNRLLRWGVKYIIGEHLVTHPRTDIEAFELAQAEKTAYLTSGEIEKANAVQVPTGNAEWFLDGQVHQLHRAGRFQLLEVVPVRE
jgi:hypothetical protein